MSLQDSEETMADVEESGEMTQKHIEDINRDQLFHDLEKRFIKLQKDFTLLRSQKDVLINENKELETQNSSLSKQVKTLEEQLGDVKSQLQQTRSSLEVSLAEKRDAQQLADRRYSELASLREDIRSLTDKLLESQKRETELQRKISEVSSDAVPLQMTVDRLNQEKDALSKQNSWLEQQLAESSSRVLQLKKQHSERVMELQSSNLQLKEEGEGLNKQLKAWKEKAARQEKMLAEEREKVKELQQNLLDSEAQAQRELATQARLTQLYKESSEEASSKVSRLENVITSLKSAVDEAEQERARLKKDSEELLKQQAESSEAKVADLEQQMSVLKKELEDAKGPGGAGFGEAARRALSVRDTSALAAEKYLAEQGYTLTDLVGRISELQDELRKAQTAREEAELYLGQVLREVEEKAPIILGQRADYERALAYHDKLSRQLDLAHRDLEAQKERLEKERAERETYEEENKSLRREVDDLSRQVQHLLKQQIGLSQGGPGLGGAGQLLLSPGTPFRTPSKQQSLIPAPTASPLSSLPPQSPAEVIITENLVTFRDIVELQSRNLQLLKVIRRLSDDREKELRVKEQVEDQKMQQLVEKLQQELEDLRERRERQQEMFAGIVQQRDMYRVLLAQADKRFLSGTPAEHRTAIVPANEGELAAQQGQESGLSSSRAAVTYDSTAREMLRELQQEFDDYKVEKRKTEQMLQEQINKLRAEGAQDKVAASQAQAEARFLQQRYESLEGIRVAAEEEAGRLRGKNGELQALLLSHQKQLQELEARVQSSAEALRSANLRISNLTIEKEISESAQKRLEEENAKLREDSARLMRLLESVQNIERELQSRAMEERERLLTEIDHQKKAAEKARESLEESQALQRQLQHQAALDLKASHEKLEAAISEASALRERAAEKDNQLLSKQQLISRLEKELAHVREQSRSAYLSRNEGQERTEGEDETGSLHLQLRAKEQELTAAKAAARDLTEQVKQYKAVSMANEKALAELSAASSQWKEEHTAKLEKAEREGAKAREELQAVQRNLKESIGDANKLREEIDRLMEEREKERARHQTDLASTAQERQQLEQRLSALSKDLEVQAKAAREAQANYQRELQLHAADAALTSELKAELERRKSLADQEREKVAELTARLMEKEMENTRRTQEGEREKMEMSERLVSLESQNNLLHSQFQALTQQLKSLQNEREDRALAGSSSAQAPESTEKEHIVTELRELVRHLRREKDISQGKLELAREEGRRLQAQVAQQQQNIEKLRKELERAIEKSDADARDDSEHAKLLAQVQQLTLLRESNAMLREESERREKRAQELEKEVKRLRDEREPLRREKTLAEAELSSLKAQIAGLTEANARWKARVDQLVDKYHQVDPEAHATLERELRELKEKAQKEAAELNGRLEGQTKELEQTKNELEDAKKARTNAEGANLNLRKFAKQWKGQAEALKARVKDLEENLSRSTKEFEEEKQRLQEAMRTTAATEETSAAAASSQLEALRREVEQLKKSLEEKEREVEQLRSSLESSRKEVEAKNVELAGVRAELTALQKKQEEEKQSAAVERKKLEDAMEAEKEKRNRLMRVMKDSGKRIKELQKEVQDLRQDKGITAPSGEGGEGKMEEEEAPSEKQPSSPSSPMEEAGGAKLAASKTPAQFPLSKETPPSISQPSPPSAPPALAQTKELPAAEASTESPEAQLRRIALQSMRAKPPAKATPGSAAKAVPLAMSKGFIATQNAAKASPAEAKAAPPTFSNLITPVTKPAEPKTGGVTVGVKQGAVAEAGLRDAAAPGNVEEQMGDAAGVVPTVSSPPPTSHGQSSPFLPLNPPSANASKSPLVFGKPGINLPLPSPSPTAPGLGSGVPVFGSPSEQPSSFFASPMATSSASQTAQGGNKRPQDQFLTESLRLEPVRKQAKVESGNNQGETTQESIALSETQSSGMANEDSEGTPVQEPGTPPQSSEAGDGGQ